VWEKAGGVGGRGRLCRVAGGRGHQGKTPERWWHRLRWQQQTVVCAEWGWTAAKALPTGRVTYRFNEWVLQV